MRSPAFTNLLLLLAIALIAATLAVPSLRGPDPAAPPPRHDPWPAGLREDLRRLREDLEVVVRLGVPGAMATGLAAPAPEDAVVVRIAAATAEKWGLTAADVRALIEALAGAAQQVRAERAAANETATMATLRNCSSAEAQFQACARADADQDGTGEFGAFTELSGARDVRDSATAGKLNPPVLSGAFRQPAPEGFIARAGYHFVIYLPDHAGDGVLADTEGFARVDADRAETTWCGYAWPAEYGVTGTRTFFVNQTGDVIATDAPEYTGPRAPPPGAALMDGGLRSIYGIAAVGGSGQDGHIWRQVN